MAGGIRYIVRPLKCPDERKMEVSQSVFYRRLEAVQSTGRFKPFEDETGNLKKH